MHASVDRAREELGFTAEVSLEEDLAKTIASYIQELENGDTSSFPV